MRTVFSALFLLGVPVLGAGAAEGDAAVKQESFGFHKAVYDAEGKLLPWTSWEDAVDREMKFYENCPEEPHGYPVFVVATFMDGNYKPFQTDNIPCTQDGMGILSYLKYWEFKGKKNEKTLYLAKKMGDYLVTEALTPDQGVYPKFTRSTGEITDFPQTRSSQHDAKFGVNVIQPDKGGIAGYALVKLYDATGDKRYLDQAVHNAKLLARNMRKGDADHAPWPFRVDSVTGDHWGERNGDMAFILRLFDELIAKGRKEFQEPRDALWQWIKTCEIPTPDSRDKNLWVQFFEDHSEDDNRTSWSPMEMARYLIEKKEALDPDWRADTEKLINFMLNNLSTSYPGGVLLPVEQDNDTRQWSGAASKLGGVAAMFYAAGGGEKYKDMAYRNLNWITYAIDNDGCPNDMALPGRNKRGGWQEDSHTDVIHNFIDAMNAVPEWRGKGSLPPVSRP
jgi:hypothetical protein